MPSPPTGSLSTAAASLASPSGGVPIKVSIPPQLQAGLDVVLSGYLDCAGGGGGTGSVTLAITYSDPSDWITPPSSVVIASPLDAQMRRHFSVRLSSRKRPGTASRRSTITVSTAGGATSDIASLSLQP